MIKHKTLDDPKQQACDTTYVWRRQESRTTRRSYLRDGLYFISREIEADDRGGTTTAAIFRTTIPVHQAYRCYKHFQYRIISFRLKRKTDEKRR